MAVGARRRRRDAIVGNRLRYRSTAGPVAGAVVVPYFAVGRNVLLNDAPCANSLVGTALASRRRSLAIPSWDSSCSRRVACHRRWIPGVSSLPS
jgi:hypothetical protein